CRHSSPDELDLITQWRIAFSVEALGHADGAELRRAAREDVARAQREGVEWLLLDGDTPVAHSVFNASLPAIVQIGGVWTPPPLRNRGYGRAVVAGSLVAAGDAGVTRAVLFTADAAATRAYEAIGFRRVGEYGLVILKKSSALSRRSSATDD
ncbi:MAG: GNAT family N-acetyltransferase, partial [Gemmatimonadales bacterium]